MRISIDDMFSPERDGDPYFKAAEVPVQCLRAALETAGLLSERLLKAGQWRFVDVFKCRFKGSPEKPRMLITVLLRVSLAGDHCKGDVSQEILSSRAIVLGWTSHEITQGLLEKVEHALKKIAEELEDRGSRLFALFPVD
jgi:hypothetical protein